MANRQFFLWMCVIVLIALVIPLFAQTSSKLFEKGLLKEKGEGDLKAAITIYEKVLKDKKADRAVEAKAQLRIGICYEKMGNAEAKKAFQSVIDNYPSHIEQVAEARIRMAELMVKKQSEPSLTHIYSWNETPHLEAQSLSPDGTKLLGIEISRSRGQNVAYKDLITGEFVNITNFDWESEGHGWTYNPVWSPDGKEVAFNLGGWKDYVQELRVADIKGKSRTIYRCESKGKGKIYSCKWFPDGDNILALHLTSDKRLQLGMVPAQGGEFKLIYEPEVPAGANLISDVTPFTVDLSPDGRHIVFHRAEDGDINLYVLEIASKTVRILTDTPANDFQPLWSPDGKYIAFLSNRSGTRALWAIPMEKEGIPGGKPFLLRYSMENASLSNWTAHGIAYENWSSMRDIYTVTVDPQTGAPTGKPKQLDFKPTGNNSNPVYSPDGKFMAFVMNPSGGSPDRNIIVYPVSGGEARSFRIPGKKSDIHDLRWLPDGSGISFACYSSKETPGWKEGMKRCRLFHLDLDMGDWRTWALDGGFWNLGDWRGDGLGYYHTRNDSDDFSSKWNIIEKDINTGSDRVIYGEGDGFFTLRCSRDYSKLALIANPSTIEIIDTKTGEKLKEFKNFRLPTWSPDGRYIMAKVVNKPSYHVISYADGTSQRYNLSDNLPKGNITFFDWSPLGNQVAFSFKFSQFDAYLINNVIPAEKK